MVEPIEIKGFQCAKCKKIYFAKVDAIDCCSIKDGKIVILSDEVIEDITHLMRGRIISHVMDNDMDTAINWYKDYVKFLESAKQEVPCCINEVINKPCPHNE